MSERDELAELLQDNITDSLPLDPRRDEVREQVETATEVILAAGYSKPRTITTAEELDALPNGSVIRTAGTDEYEPRVAVKLSNWNGSAEWDVADCEELSVMTGELDDLPATVLWEPK